MPSEEILAEIWEQFLKVPGIGAGDNFLALGGNSLVAMQVVYRVRQVFGVELAIRTIFDLPTQAPPYVCLDANQPDFVASGPARWASCARWARPSS